MKHIVAFTEGSADQADLLGGKGANLAEMTRLGLPVPPGFTITTEACRAWMASNGTWPEGLRDELRAAVETLEDEQGSTFGGTTDPLLLSVRSGARYSMPGMMDTVLNVGLGPGQFEALAATTGDERFALDARRRLLDLFGRVVLDVPANAVAEAVRPYLEKEDVNDPSLLSPALTRHLIDTLERLIQDATGSTMPSDPMQQLEMAVDAVFRSWTGRRARDYRRLESIPDDLGTAVNVQVMVFGNTGEQSGTGVAFTRDPTTGAPEPYGDFLLNAQGEDVVAGIRTTDRLEDLGTRFPGLHAELLDHLATIERRYRDMCDVEFTIDRGRLWVLQTRIGKRTPQAAVRIAVELAQHGIIDPAEAVRRVTPRQLDLLAHPAFDPAATVVPLTTGLAVSPGAAVGRVVLNADEAAAAADDVILVTTETSPDDLHGIVAARGLLTSRGGLVSHAAIVARGLGKPAVCGAADIEVDLGAGRFVVGDVTVHAGEIISIDGTTGRVVVGAVDVTTPAEPAELETLLDWADELRRLGVRANADTPQDAERARAAGAEGIGLCRTEHQFLGERLPIVQQLILATETPEIDAALAQLHELQVADFRGLLEAMDGLEVTIRLLDPPLHEFLPDVTELVVAEATQQLDDAGRRLLEAARRWAEHNPMLGIRGVRLGLLRPEIYRMQSRALAEAAVARLEAGGHPRVQVMIPLVSMVGELTDALEDVHQVFREVAEKAGRAIPYRVGTMVETPRAALTAAALAVHAEFLSFGTNDLTQMTFGFSRDDVEAVLMPNYHRRGIISADPFATVDAEGVGELVRMAVERARAVRPDIELGVCGEHGGDPASIAIFDRIGVDYVSCSPSRVRNARLAAARATVADSAELAWDV